MPLQAAQTLQRRRHWVMGNEAKGEDAVWRRRQEGIRPPDKLKQKVWTPIPADANLQAIRHHRIKAAAFKRGIELKAVATQRMLKVRQPLQGHGSFLLPAARQACGVDEEAILVTGL